ncbi:MAG: hypothetical protein KJO35_09025, partial [Gammaproteobacteria bacterium]|nr:hypothetical protein [Gammaproteobacteria bacterium]
MHEGITVTMAWNDRAAVRTTAAVLLLVLCQCLAAGVAKAADDEAGAVVADVRRPSELNVSIVAFDPGIPTDASSHRRLQVFPRIREVEASFLPFVLRDTLVNTEQWGAVRVVPEPDIAAELLISGTIVRSDGATLELQIRAVDATGRVWLNGAYAATIPGPQDNLNARQQGFQQLYDSIERDLRRARAQIDEKSLADIAEVSLLRYADQLAPAAFGAYLNTTDEGTYEILRLPAENDPMLERIERIRRVEY